MLRGTTKHEPHEYVSILEQQTQSNQRDYIEKLKIKCELEPYSSSALRSRKRVLTKVVLEFGDLRARCDVLTRKEGTSCYIPTLVVGTYKISKVYRLQLAFIGYVLSKLQKEKPELGYIVTGESKAHKVKLNLLYREISSALLKLRIWTSAQEYNPPLLFLNKHCTSCCFQEICTEDATQKDHLSLLKGISKKEIVAHNKKGIFTVNQLAYTYRSRRPRKDTTEYKTPKYYRSLKALAIRDNKTYIVEPPQIRQAKTYIYFDVEGVPDRGFYYLIGVVMVRNMESKKFSFWADNENEEEKIWLEFLSLVTKQEDFVLFHYGNYEITFINKMHKKYGKPKHNKIVKSTLANTVNCLSVMYGRCYFPTYSNGLKDIGAHLGYKWTENGASGLQSLVWRHNWETGDIEDKGNLIRYNLDDCFALEQVVNELLSIATIEGKADENDMHRYARVGDIETEKDYSYCFQNFRSPIINFEKINKYGYFDYQRNKVYLKTDASLRKVVKKCVRNKVILRANKVIKFPNPRRCRACHSTHLHKSTRIKRKFIDLLFTRFGIKRWVVEYQYRRMNCVNCGKSTRPNESLKLSQSNYGPGLKIWSVNMFVNHRVNLYTVNDIIRDSFGINLSKSIIRCFKSEMAMKYASAADFLLREIVSGSLVQIDETSVKVKGFSKPYVWVFANMNTVYYIFKPNREADFLKEILKNFSGVLISDFYPGYESLSCAQQKCLIHLMRDLNEDFLQNQFNEEYKNLVTRFSELLNAIMNTINTYGLRKRNLNKHRKDVKKFYFQVIETQCKTDLMEKWQKRFKKNEEVLFTFLQHNNCPWNNNNAEHAIIPFAKYRTTRDTDFTEKSIKEYLILLSIQQTCKYRGVSFLEFLKSGKKSVSAFTV